MIKFITPVNLNLSTTGSWFDVDVSSYVSTSATGVLLHFVNPTESIYKCSVRKKGSTDDFSAYGNINANNHYYGAIGLDSNNVFEAYLQNADVDIYIVGYTEGETTFLTNANTHTLTSTNTWTDFDTSSYAPGAVGVIVQIVNTSSSSKNYGIRKNGSADNYISQVIQYATLFAFIGVDENGIFEFNAASTGVSAKVVGYFTDGVVFHTNATDYGLVGNNTTYFDLPALPSDAIGGFYELSCPTTSMYYSFRKKGTSENIYHMITRQGFAVIECDTDKIVEVKAWSNNAFKVLNVGYIIAGTETTKRRFAQIF